MKRTLAILAVSLAVATGGCTVEATGFASDFQGYHEASSRASTSEALVGSDGRCSANLNIDPSLLRPADGGAMPLGSTECEVVARMGGPYSVVIDRGPAGERLVRLTYVSGPRIGIYHFVNNRLKSVEH
jgi:hypothetical protein